MYDCEKHAAILRLIGHVTSFRFTIGDEMNRRESYCTKYFGLYLFEMDRRLISWARSCAWATIPEWSVAETMRYLCL